MYISTRGNIEKQSPANTVALGMVPSGGLFVPETIPRLGWQDAANTGYPGLALKIMGMYLTDLPQTVLEKAVEVYEDGRFDGQNPAPLVHAGDCGYLELWHGPTAAFKDMALQVLPLLLKASLKNTGSDAEVLILTATSGDTGKAALEGFKDVAGTRIVVFYPDGGVSAVQERQMLTTGGANTSVVAVKGNFDECQTAVKEVFSSPDLRDKMGKKNMVLSSANSINWGRLLPQIVYYYWAYLQAVGQDRIKPDELLNIVVPTGNFGNILAAYYAKKMGLPLGKLICASNRNNVLFDFFRTGIYNSQRPFYLTSSPSMDILISSNFERFLFEMSGRSAQKILEWFTGLKREGKFEVDPETLARCRENMSAGWSDEQEVAAAIKQEYAGSAYLLDPHTAVGRKVYRKYREESGDNRYTVIASTASPFKFASSVLSALKGDFRRDNTGREDDPMNSLKELSAFSGWEVPKGLKGLQEMPAKPAFRCGPQEISKYLLKNFFNG